MKIEIIAEIAQGYEGNTKLAELLTVGAIASGSDAVKFHIVYADELATPDYKYYDFFKTLEMNLDKWIKISKLVHKNGQKIYFDIFGEESLLVARKANADGVKLSTTEFYNRDLVTEALGIFNKIFISVGGIPIEDIDMLSESLLKSHKDKICLMYGFQSEPTPLNQNNLLKLTSFRKKYPDYNLGFMDHSDGSSIDAYNLSLVAMGLGINVIEKHLTLDRSLKIEDYISGLSPDNFKEFVELIRKYEPALGSDSLKLSKLEENYRNNATKLVIAKKNLYKNDIIDKIDVTLKRTGSEQNGIPIRQFKDIINKKLKIDIKINHPIFEEHICEN